MQGSNFSANSMVFQSLKAMGFADADIVAALELSHNDIMRAAEILSDGTDVHGLLAKQKEDVMDSSNPAVQELLKNSRIHASLVDPRIQGALEAMVQDPQSAGTFMHDDTVRPVLVLVSQIISNRAPR